ncbi:hypothetical protein KHQ88_01660 [Mycoplasmatota bacterium]|nr:hypothetical protein KHQ88_01660 [Mycoplasmatota bacterium]
MKKLFSVGLLVLVSFVALTSQSVFAAVESPYIDMINTETISDGETWLVEGYYSYNGNIDQTDINMVLDHNFVKVKINYKSNNVEIDYILEVYHSGNWQEVKRVSSKADSGGIVDIFTPIYAGYTYRLKVENPDQWFGRSTVLDIKWWAIS